MRSLIKKAVILACMAMGLFFIAHRVLFFRQGLLERLASQALYPVLVAGEALNARVVAIKNYFQTNAMLHARCVELEAAHDALQQEVVQLKAGEHFHRQTEELKSFLDRYNLEKKLFAKILIQHFGDEEHYVYINRGSRDGVFVDMIALYKFQILGRVTTVYPWYSKVVLITDRHSKVAAYANDTNADGIVRGQGKLDECEFAYVSSLLNVINEDLVISSGQGLVFPEGFCLGQIVRHELKEHELYHAITVRPLVDFRQIRFCWLTDQSKIDFF